MLCFWHEKGLGLEIDWGQQLIRSARHQDAGLHTHLSLHTSCRKIEHNLGAFGTTSHETGAVPDEVGAAAGRTSARQARLMLPELMVPDEFCSRLWTNPKQSGQFHSH